MHSLSSERIILKGVLYILDQINKHSPVAGIVASITKCEFSGTVILRATKDLARWYRCWIGRSKA